MQTPGWSTSCFLPWSRQCNTRELSTSVTSYISEFFFLQGKEILVANLTERKPHQLKTTCQTCKWRCGQTFSSGSSCRAEKRTPLCLFSAAYHCLLRKEKQALLYKTVLVDSLWLKLWGREQPKQQFSWQIWDKGILWQRGRDGNQWWVRALVHSTTL